MGRADLDSGKYRPCPLFHRNSLAVQQHPRLQTGRSGCRLEQGGQLLFGALVSEPGLLNLGSQISWKNRRAQPT